MFMMREDVHEEGDVCMQYVMELAERLLDLHICYILPDHSNNLANQFRWLCFGKDMINYYSF